MANLLGATNLTLADPDTIRRITGAPVGFAGPIGLKEEIPFYADHAVMAVERGVVGGNKKDTHLINLDPKRDLEPLGVKAADLRLVVEGTAAPLQEGKLQLARGSRWVRSLNSAPNTAKQSVQFILMRKETQTMVMGCYGIMFPEPWLQPSNRTTMSSASAGLWQLLPSGSHRAHKLAGRRIQGCLRKLYAELEARGIEVL